MLIGKTEQMLQKYYFCTIMLILKEIGYKCRSCRDFGSSLLLELP